jgi:uncharacterized protein (DUF2236 family)
MAGRDAGLFPADAIVRRVDAEAILLLGGGRALLMQLAHPMVAAGVAEHSGFASDPFTRLRRTLDATFTIVFGTAAQAEQTAAALRAVHDRVVGPGYQANDPELLMWVHATLVDTALRVHGRFLRPLHPDDAERYYLESMTIAEVLGVPLAEQPPDLGAFRAYVREMVGSLEVSDTARRLAVAILHPRMPLAPAFEPAMVLARQLTIGLLPEPLRAGYRLSWDRRRQAALALVGAASRQVLPRVPAILRRVPAA